MELLATVIGALIGTVFTLAAYELFIKYTIVKNYSKPMSAENRFKLYKDIYMN